MTGKRGRPRQPRKRGRPPRRQPQQSTPLPHAQVIDPVALFTSSYPLHDTLRLLAERYQGNLDFEQGQGDGRALFQDGCAVGVPLEDIPGTLYEALGADFVALVGQGEVLGVAALPADYQAYLWGCVQGCLAAVCAEANRQEREDLLAYLQARRAAWRHEGEATYV